MDASRCWRKEIAVNKTLLRHPAEKDGSSGSASEVASLFGDMCREGAFVFFTKATCTRPISWFPKSMRRLRVRAPANSLQQKQNQAVLAATPQGSLFYGARGDFASDALRDDIITERLGWHFTGYWLRAILSLDIKYLMCKITKIVN